MDTWLLLLHEFLPPHIICGKTALGSETFQFFRNLLQIIGFHLLCSIFLLIQ